MYACARICPPQMFAGRVRAFHLVLAVGVAHGRVRAFHMVLAVGVAHVPARCQVLNNNSSRFGKYIEIVYVPLPLPLPRAV